MKQYDAIVVGGGVIGKTVALRLGMNSLRVLCIDPQCKANGSASVAAGAMLGAFGEVTVDSTSDMDEKELDFRVLSSELYPNFLAELQELSNTSIYQKRGTFVIANNVGQLDRFNLQKIAETLGDYSKEFEWVEPTAIPNFKPNKGYMAYQALYLAEESSVSTADLMGALTLALESSQHVDLLDDAVTSLLIHDCTVKGVATQRDGYIYADTVVLCAGIGVQQIVDASVGVTSMLPTLMPGKGVSVIVDSEEEFEHVIRTPNRDFACGTHVVPRGTSSVYIGATNRIANTPGLKDGATAGELHSLLHSAIHEINTSFRTCNVERIQFGSRPIAIDRYSLIGRTELEGLSVATGTYRNGVLMTPLIAEVLTDEVLGRPARYENPFSPIGRKLKVDQVSSSVLISNGVRDLVSFVQEPGGFLPYNRAEELQDFIHVLAETAILQSKTYQDLIRESQELLEHYPISEIIPQLFYRYHDLLHKKRP